MQPLLIEEVETWHIVALLIGAMALMGSSDLYLDGESHKFLLGAAHGAGSVMLVAAGVLIEKRWLL